MPPNHAHPPRQLTVPCVGRVPEQKGPERFMRGLRAFIENFFRCEDCRAHFLEQLNQPAAAALQTRNDAVEWLWRTHNGVNARLAEVRPTPNAPPLLPASPSSLRAHSRIVGPRALHMCAREAPLEQCMALNGLEAVVTPSLTFGEEPMLLLLVATLMMRPKGVYAFAAAAGASCWCQLR